MNNNDNRGLRVNRVQPVVQARSSLLFAGPFSLLLFASLSSSGCSDEPMVDLGGVDVDPNGGNICLRVNCQDNTDCKDCADGATVCDTSEKRCIACGPKAGGKQCAAGEKCTDFGNCVGSQVSCAVDSSGTPTVTCATDADCGACSPKFRACDTKSKKCVGCTEGNKKQCQTTDICVQNTCTPACPPKCALDSDCAKCNTAGAAALKCFRGECAQCNDDAQCKSGEMCDDHGKCVPSCGSRSGASPDRPGSCGSDSDCAACTTGTTSCKLPVVGRGVCASPATGCSDLGGSVTLPSPFNRITNTCSNDMDCAGVSADINVGELLRKVTGIGGIQDAKLQYPMKRCAPIKLTNDLNCGVCMPCQSDDDCDPIDVAQTTGGLFGPLGSIAARILFDKVFGPNQGKIHMYCTKLTGEYGACVPCSNVLSACGKGKEEGPPATDCSHGTCDPGKALAPSCDSGCAGKVCKEDPYCCSESWDRTCVERVERLCAPERTCAGDDSCEFKEPNKWYCAESQPFGYFHCDANGNKDTTLQCQTTQFCHRVMKGAAKSPAKLGTDGKPQCFNTKQ